jgi:hypothetical protein
MKKGRSWSNSITIFHVPVFQRRRYDIRLAFLIPSHVRRSSRGAREGDGAAGGADSDGAFADVILVGAIDGLALELVLAGGEVVGRLEDNGLVAGLHVIPVVDQDGPRWASHQLERKHAVHILLELAADTSKEHWPPRVSDGAADAATARIVKAPMDVKETILVKKVKRRTDREMISKKQSSE